MDSLSDKTSIKMVKKTLDALPKGSKALDLAYDGAMQRVDSQLEGHRHLAKQLLGWLTYSERLMSVQEIQYALAIEPGESSLDEDNLSDVTEMVGYCAGLVVVEEDTRSLRLVHYTTQEYFRQNSGKHLVATQQDIAISCLTYLLYEEFGDGWVYKVEGQHDCHESYVEGAVKARLQKYPFLGYAARHWASHASMCEQQVVKELIISFAKQDRKVSSAGQAMLMVDDKRYFIGTFHYTGSSSPLSAMHVLAYIGNKAMFSELLNHGFEADTKDSSHRTPLWWAVEGGYHSMVEFLLLENRLKVNNRDFKSNTIHVPTSTINTPLHVAVYHGYTSIVKLLLDCTDIDINLRDNFGTSPLYVAAICGHTLIVKLLLDCADIDVNVRSGLGNTPLHQAVSYNHTRIVKLLLDCPSIDVNLGDEYGYTPLHRAAIDGLISTVKLLLDRTGINVNSRNWNGRTPLHVAAIKGGPSILKLLCAHPKVDLNSKDNEGRDVFSIVNQEQDQNQDYETNEERDKHFPALEEHLDIIRAAMEERKSRSSAQLAEQSSQP